MESLAKKLQLRTLEDWYQVSSEDLQREGAMAILTRYDSPLQTLTNIFPEYNWRPWRFARIPPGFWTRKNNVREFFEWFIDQLPPNINLALVPRQYIVKLGGSSLVSGTNVDMISLLAKYFPEKDWSHFGNLNISNGQATLYLIVQKYFPDEQIHLNYQHPSMVFSSQRKVELDIFLPSLQLAFEYQVISVCKYSNSK
jgi:hypothetical protein